jgi:uncharacterized protein YcnI
MRIALVLGSVLVLGAPVSAHMVVLPAASQAGGVERYTLIVPTEGRSATVRIELRVPMGVEIGSLEAKPGWQGANEPFPIGAATLRWSGGRIPPGEMMSFDFLAENPPVAHTLTWSATQWYEDGSSDAWGQGAPPDHHASTTTLTAAGAAGTAGEPAAHAHVHEAEPETQHERHLQDGAQPPPDARSPATFWMALTALALALTALGVAARRRREP